MKPIKRTVLIGDKTSFILALKGVIEIVNRAIFLTEDDFESKLLKERAGEVFIILNTIYDTSAQINKWLWKRVRLNEEKIGRELAGAPVVVLGMDRKFLEKPEGKVFRDYKSFHQYITKPLKLMKFLKAISILSPIDPSSLPIIKQDAPESLLDALEHDLKDISKKFNYSRTDEELKKQFHNVENDFRNFEFLEKNKKRIQKVKKEVERLNREIIKRRGEIWE